MSFVSHRYSWFTFLVLLLPARHRGAKNLSKRFNPTLFLFIGLFSFENTFAQKTGVSSETLSSNQVVTLFTGAICKALDLRFPIVKAYMYSDKSGKYYVALTESRDVISNNNDTMNYQIRAVAFKINAGKLEKIWELNDHIVKNYHEESSIWFWSKYVDFKDYDNDFLIEPVIVYGTTGLNDLDDGRLKILIYYKGQKITIRHQNGDLDAKRETQVDKAFYLLPQGLQKSVIEKMDAMEKNQQTIFPFGWRAAMRNKKTFITERKQ